MKDHMSIEGEVFGVIASIPFRTLDKNCDSISSAYIRVGCRWFEPIQEDMMQKTIRETRQIVIDQMLKEVDLTYGMAILEPSAGVGNLANGILRAQPELNVTNIDCIELNGDMCKILREQGFKTIHGDFLKIKPTRKYDLVIGCPTYKDNVDMEHIIHMYSFLWEGGTLVALTHPCWTVENSERQKQFRSWLSDKNYHMKMLTDMSFVEEYETQPSMILRIEK